MDHMNITILYSQYYTNNAVKSQSKILAEGKNVVFDNNTYPGLQDWFLNLMLQWHRQDSVSTKEINRQEAIYKFQNNRNPFIDHPELVEHIWGDKKNIAWTTTITTSTDNIELDDISLHILNKSFFISSDYYSNLEYVLYDISGCIIMKDKINPDKIISLENLNRGIYILVVISNNITHSYKIIL